MEETLAGQRLGPYQLHEVIGRGGMGVVYRASQPSIGRDVAIKVIGARYARHPAFIARFEREARAVASLQHPHILPVYDVGVAEGQPYLVTAYLPGGTLARRIAAHPAGLPLPDVLRITTQIAAALDHAHAAGIIHCDLKPGNVLLDQQGNAYLADFGIARIAQEAGLDGRRPGTREYMAPEVAAGAAPGPASDIYALGLIVFEMLVGRRPFQEGPASCPDDSSLADPLDVCRWRTHLPRGVSVAIRQVLGVAPDARPPLAGAFALSLALASGVAPAYRLPAAGSLPPGRNGDSAVEEVLPLTPVEGPGTDPFTPPPLLDSPALDSWLIPTEYASPAEVPTRPAARVGAAGRGASPLAVVITAALVLQLVVLFFVIVIALGQSPLY